MDGYDKLKPYGFEIHGCIDEYSTRLLWLTVIRSSKGPKVVCNLYFNYLLIAKGVQQKNVADQGTENVNIAGSQRFLRRNHSDDSSGYRNFQFKKSIKNQRIDSFSSQLRHSYFAHVQIGGFVFSRELCMREYTITLIICRLNVLSFAFSL